MTDDRKALFEYKRLVDRIQAFSDLLIQHYNTMASGQIPKCGLDHVENKTISKLADVYHDAEIETVRMMIQNAISTASDVQLARAIASGLSDNVNRRQEYQKMILASDNREKMTKILTDLVSLR